MATQFRKVIKAGACLWPGVIVAGLLLIQVVPCWYVTPDSAVYIELGRNLAAGRGYVYNEEPFYGYPPIFPALLAAAIRLFGDSYLVMRAVNVLAAAAFLILSFVLIRKLAGWRVALFATWAFGLSLELSVQATFILSDLAGSALAIGALVALERFARTTHARGRVDGTWFVATGLVLLAVLTRLANLEVVIGIILFFFVLRRDRFSSNTWRTVAPLVLVVLGTVALWYAARFTSQVSYHQRPFIALLRDHTDWDSGYLGPVGLLWQTIGNFGRGFDAISAMMTGRIGAMMAWGRLVLPGLFFLGLAVAVVKRRGLVESYTLSVLVVSFAVPFSQGSRYYLSIAPLVFFYAYEAVAWLVGLARRLGPRGRQFAGYTLAGLLLVPIVLIILNVRPFHRVHDHFVFWKIVTVSVAFAVSMVFLLPKKGRLSLCKAVLLVAAALLLAMWTDLMLFRSLSRIYKLREAQHGLAVYYPLPEVVQIADELKSRAGPDEAFVSGTPSLYRGLTGRRSYLLPRTLNKKRALKAYRNARWVIIETHHPRDFPYAYPFIRAHADLFELVARNKLVQLWYRTGELPETDEVPASGSPTPSAPQEPSVE